MGDFNRAPAILVQTTYTVYLGGGTPTQKNIPLSSLPASVVDRIPPRLRNSLRGTIEYVALVHKTSGAGVQTEVQFFGNDTFYASANITRTNFMGMQKFTASDFDASSATYAVADAENVGLFYRDKDNTGEFHVRVEPAATGAAPAAASLRFIWRPEIGIV